MQLHPLKGDTHVSRAWTIFFCIGTKALLVKTSPVSIPGCRRIVPEPATRDSYAICSVAVLLFFDPLKPFHVIWGAKQILQPACFTSMLSCSSGEPLAFPSVPLLPSLNHPLMHHILLQHPQPVIVIETQDTCETHNPCCYPWMQNAFSSPR